LFSDVPSPRLSRASLHGVKRNQTTYLASTESRDSKLEYLRVRFLDHDQGYDDHGPENGKSHGKIIFRRATHVLNGRRVNMMIGGVKGKERASGRGERERWVACIYMLSEGLRMTFALASTPPVAAGPLGPVRVSRASPASHSAVFALRSARPRVHQLHAVPALLLIVDSSFSFPATLVLSSCHLPAGRYVSRTRGFTDSSRFLCRDKHRFFISCRATSRIRVSPMISRDRSIRCKG